MIRDPARECADYNELMNKYIIPQLSSLFIKAYNNFSYYKWRFDESGIDPYSDPLEIIEKMPFMTKKDYSMLEQDAIYYADKRLYNIEMTSGSTGRPKRRFQSRLDELNELRIAERVISGFDLSSDDIILFMDVGNPSIYMWFARAFESLGLKDTIYYSIQSDFNKSLQKLKNINPSVIFTIPSLLARSYDTIVDLKLSNLKKIIYFGEKMNDQFRKQINEDLGVEIFSHYGTTETSTLGGECSAHDGIHIYTDVNLPTLLDYKTINEFTQEGEVAWTTMQIDIQPVIKYRVGDVIQIDYSPCKCGRTSPRIKIIGRTDAGFSLYGEKFYYETFLNTIYKKFHEPGLLQLILSNKGSRETITILIPEKMKDKEKIIVESIYSINELEFFMEEKFVEIKVEFVPNNYFIARKIPLIIDEREY